MKKTMKACFYIFISFALIIFITLQIFLKPIILFALQKSGIEGVQLEGAHIKTGGIELKNITIDSFFHAKISNLTITPKGDVRIEGLAGVFEGVKFTKANGNIYLDSFSNVSLQNQIVTVGTLNAGLPLSDGKIVLSLTKEGALTVHQSSWSLAGGSISSSPFTINLKNPSADVTLTARQLDLVELFKLAPMEGLDATGRVDGRIPVQLRGNAVTIVNGVLETTGQGGIRYSPKEIPAFLQDGSRKEILDLRVALEAFRYDSLKMTLNGAAGGTQKISLQVKGHNPQFYGGRPVVVNFNVEGPLQSVIQYAPGGSNIADGVREQIETYERVHGTTEK